MLALDHARAVYWEDPLGALATAIECAESARVLGDSPLRARALALQGAITLHRGDLRGAMALATEAAAETPAGDGIAAAEIAALQALVMYFSGSYGEALSNAERAIVLADGEGDLALRIFVRRAGCPVFGNLGLEDLPERVEELLALTIEAGDGWEEAVSRNDRGCLLQAHGDLEGADRELSRGMEIAAALPRNHFALALLHSTRADLRLETGPPEAALADAERSIAHLLATGEPNPYVYGVTVRAHVQALQSLGRLDEARAYSEGALQKLGERVPQARSLILATVAEALRAAGRLEEAYDTLARSARAGAGGVPRALAAAARHRARQARGAGRPPRGHPPGGAGRARPPHRLPQPALPGARARAHDRGRRRRPLQPAVLDLDRFKAINDAHGQAPATTC